MNKKRHQGDPSMDDSTESCDENQNMVECVHIKNAINLQNIKKELGKKGFKTECEECGKMPQNDLEMNGDIEYDLSLWMCLKCGNQACGRAKNEHALKHYKTPHSDSHDMCVNTTNWNVWCYGCDDDINITCKKKLLEAVEYVRKQAESNKTKQTPSMPLLEDHVIETISKSTSTGTLPKITNNLVTLPRARGLMNLGNTCFFNSVMQCLGQTPYLLELLDETAQGGQYFKLPGGKFSAEDKDSEELPPLEGILEKWRPLTSTLAETLRELRSGRAEVYVPRVLLSKLTYRMPQFGGGDQHDSHELLRFLLEAVREEDLKRYQTVILDKLETDQDLVEFINTCLNRKTDPASVEDEKKKIIKYYGQQASELLLPTEQVFRGVLVSTLQCQDCGHTSHRDEFFLDLSLPISEKQIPPVLRRKAEDIEDNKPSKHQIKKEKRAERKKNKKQKSVKTLNASVATNPTLSVADAIQHSSGSNSEESDADVEDNVEEGSTNMTEFSKGVESGYNSDKVDNSSPDSNNRGASPDMRVDDSGVLSPAINMLSPSPDSIDESSLTNVSRTSASLKNSSSLNVLSRSPASPGNSPVSSETDIDVAGSPYCGHNSPAEENAEEFDRPESRMSFVKTQTRNSDLKVDLAKLSLLNDGDTTKVNKLFESQEMHDAATDLYDDDMKGACSIEDENAEDEAMQEDDESSILTGTLSPRYQCEEGECSVQSCLNQFTSCELMTGNNKVRCDLCTKRRGGAEKKAVYTNATKQLLIYNPPAVLILHLKRFQVCRFRSAKVSKHVKFPTILDIAPFCSRRSQNLPTFETGQTRVLYSLYGVVEHSGSMHGGHYVAYIKVRSKIEENSPRWQYLPKNQRGERVACGPKGAEADPETPSGKWYYISDSHVSEVPESKVLGAQAYLLFYERIL